MNDLILDTALAFAQQGCSVVPTRPDGTKAPTGSWQAYQTTRPTAEQLTEWLMGSAYDGIGLVCGAVSHNLEMLELEGRAVEAGLPRRLTELAEATGLGSLWAKITTGYCEQTPSGGLHLLYRVDDDVAGNTKLARRPATTAELAENPTDKVKVLIETRGEGGYVIVAPSNGRTHPTGKPWSLIQGSTETIPTISASERDAIHRMCRTFDQMPAHEARDQAQGGQEAGGRPGDDYNARTSWDDILTPRGWAKLHTDRAGITYWRRPGKKEGISATTGRGDGDNLYVFSTSTEFDAETPYSKFAAYTLLEHRGDYTAAARALRAAGYGDDEPRATTINDSSEWSEPMPLGQSYPPPLPVAACGPILGPLVREIGEDLQVPTDLVINMALSVVTTAAQGRWRIRLTPRSQVDTIDRIDRMITWTEILSISSTSVAASGERKSQILSILSTVLGGIEKELREQAAPNVRWREEEIRLAEARVAEARRAAQKDPFKEPALRAEVEALEALQPIHLPRLMADDATPEALMHVLDQQKGTIGVLSAEPGFFATLAGRYNSGVANLDGVLKATSGEPIRVDRVSRETIHIEHPCLTVSICVQPGLLDQLGKRPELRHAGFLARFLYVVPQPMVGRRNSVNYVNPTIYKEAFSSSSSSSIRTNTDIPTCSLPAYEASLRSLAIHSYSQKQLTELTELTLTAEAQEYFDQFRTELEPRLHPHTGDLSTIADWGSKLPGAIARIAASLTLLEDPKAEVIQEWTMCDAIQLGEAYIPHAVHVLDGIRGHRDNFAEARDVIRVIQRRGWSTFSLRDITRQLANTEWVKGYSGRAAEVTEEQLDILTDYGHIRPLPEEPRTGAGRKPSPRYEVNPCHLKETTP